MIDGRNFFEQSIKNDLKKYDNIIARLQHVKVMITQLDVFRLSLFQKILQINCNRFKQTTKTRS